MPYYLSYTLSVIIYFTLFLRRRRITKLVHVVVLLSQQKSLFKYDLAVILMLIIQMIVICCLFILHHFGQSKKQFFEIYGTSKLMYFLDIPILTLSRLLHPTFTNLVSILYCDLCHQCTVSLSNVKSSINSCPHYAFKDDYLIRIVNKRGQIVKAIKAIQKEFSLVCSLLCCSELLGCFVGLWQILNTSELVNILQFVRVALYFSNSFVFLTTVIAVTGQVPLEMDNLGDAARQKMDSNFIQKSRHFHPYLVSSLTYRPDVTLSASGLLHFTRPSVLAVLGTFFTYSILILSLFK